MSQVAAVPPPAQSPHVPPQNLEAEESVLGAMLLSPGAIGAVTEILSATDFYRESHGVVFLIGAQLDEFLRAEAEGREAIGIYELVRRAF